MQAEDFKDGQIIVIDKPLGWTSFQVVNKIRWLIRKKFDLKKPFKPWLRTILINTCINNFRKKKLDFNAGLEEAENQPMAEEILSDISYQEILDMIRELSPAYRAGFNLHVIEGYKHEEISNMLGISIGTSKSNLFKAKDKLRRMLQEYLETDYGQAIGG